MADTQHQTLLPCPFCGNEDPRVSRMRDESLWSHAEVEKTSVRCGDCDVATPYTEEGQEPEAIELWNTRAAESAATPQAEPPEHAEFGDPRRAMTEPELQEFCIALSFEQDDYTEEVIRSVEARMLAQPLFVDRVDETQAEPPQAQPAALSKDALVDLIREHMRGVYHCTRVWEAWSVGTMSEDDFDPYDESDSPDELADVILAALSAHPSAPSQAQPVDPAPLYYVTRWSLTGRHAVCEGTTGRVVLDLDEALSAAHPVETAAQPETESECLGASLTGPTYTAAQVRRVAKDLDDEGRHPRTITLSRAACLLDEMATLLDKSLGAPASPSGSPLQPAVYAAIPGAGGEVQCCESCDDGDGQCAFPYYGAAPHTCFMHIPGATIGQSRELKPAEWPSNFKLDPEAGPATGYPRGGTYTHCLACGRARGMEARQGRDAKRLDGEATTARPEGTRPETGRDQT